MRMALIAKNKIGFIDGSIPILEIGDSLFHSWQHNNNIVASWIINSISKDLASSVLLDFCT